jgi:hypothetical protein
MKALSKRFPSRASAAVEPKLCMRKRNADCAQDLEVEKVNAQLGFLENNGG